MELLQQSKSKLSILIAEDDENARETLCLMVKMKLPDANIYSAEDGSKGVELFKTFSEDIVITDVSMPVMNGIEMAGEIKSIKGDTKFIVLTAYNEKIFFEKFSVIGFSSYILKPIEFKKLFIAIEKCIAEIMPSKQV